MSVHMQHLATTVVAIGIAALAQGEPVPVLHLPSPMTLHSERAPDGAASLGAARLAVDPSVLANVEPGDHVFIYDFPLSEDYTVTLQLEAFSAIAHDARFVEVVLDRRGRPVEIEHPWPSVHTLMGHVVGEPSSRVYLAIGDRLANARIAVDGTRYVIGTSAIDDLTLVYDEGNVPEGFFTDAPFTCGVSSPRVDDGAVKRTDTGGYRDAAEPCKAVRIALDTDVEFSELFGGDTTAAAEYATTLLGDVSSVYQENLDVQLIGSYFRAWTAPDPWTETSLGGQLGEFTIYWSRNMNNVERGLAHLLCGRHLGGGMAFLSQVCRPLGYGIETGLAGTYPMPLESQQAGNWDPMVFAHETGHNFSMIHTHEMAEPPDQCAFGGCDEADGATIMSYCHLCAPGIANIDLSFHDDNVDSAIDHLSSVTCDLWTDGGPPTVIDDSAACEYDGYVDVFVLSNDFANDCSDLELFGHDLISARGGTVEGAWGENPAGEWELVLRYTAPGNITGIDVFTYSVRDGTGNEDVGTVIVNILKPPPGGGGGPGGFNPDDLIRIISVWGDRSADWNGDGTVDVKDLDALLNGEPQQPRR